MVANHSKVLQEKVGAIGFIPLSIRSTSTGITVGQLSNPGPVRTNTFMMLLRSLVSGMIRLEVVHINNNIFVDFVDWHTESQAPRFSIGLSSF